MQSAIRKVIFLFLILTQMMQSFEAIRPFCYKNSKGYCFIDCLDSAITDHTANTDLLPNYSESIIELNSFQDSGIRLWIIGSWAKKKEFFSKQQRVNPLIAVPKLTFALM